MKLFKKVKNIHFVGIGGAGMIGIARVLLKKGYKISGSDIYDSHDLKKIKKDGAKVFIGHHKENITGANLIVASSAINKTNPELTQAKKDSITIIPRAEMLGSIMIGYESIAIAGSHGKTTTTSMIAKILSVANLSPTYVVGGKVLSTDENSDLGEGKYLVAEADESDGTFTHLQPDVAVLTNIDDDHLVHYNNIFENLLDSFVMFISFAGFGFVPLLPYWLIPLELLEADKVFAYSLGVSGALLFFLGGLKSTFKSNFGTIAWSYSSFEVLFMGAIIGILAYVVGQQLGSALGSNHTL